MAIKQLAKEAGDVLLLNTTVLSLATFSNIEVVLKIILLVISIVYTADKWYFQKKKRDGKK
jgi:hypothetical protein|tara:strand:+ start:646 stop:828 length:183 start_codon:yes stop_codon:yes gene_type:complete